MFDRARLGMALLRVAALLACAFFLMLIPAAGMGGFLSASYIVSCIVASAVAGCVALVSRAALQRPPVRVFLVVAATLAVLSTIRIGYVFSAPPMSLFLLALDCAVYVAIAAIALRRARSSAYSSPNSSLERTREG